MVGDLALTRRASNTSMYIFFDVITTFHGTSHPPLFLRMLKRKRVIQTMPVACSSEHLPGSIVVLLCSRIHLVQCRCSHQQSFQQYQKSVIQGKNLKIWNFCSPPYATRVCRPNIFLAILEAYPCLGTLSRRTDRSICRSQSSLLAPTLSRFPGLTSPVLCKLLFPPL
jgi:hypothetical protein